MSYPSSPPPVPALVDRFAAGRPVRAVWINDEGGVSPVDRLVVCHGDACAPNTLIDDDGRCCGHVDFGDLGVADRWADLAVATLSLGWNYPGRNWESEFYDAYGLELREPDTLRIDYYRRLWQAPDGASD